MRATQKAFTLVEIMTVVAFIGILTAIAVPAFFRSREISRMRSCQENLRKIDGAKQQWALDTNQPATAEPDWSVLIGMTAYIRVSPSCPAGGAYTLGTIAEDPGCSRSTQTPYPHTFEIEPVAGTQ